MYQAISLSTPPILPGTLEYSMVPVRTRLESYKKYDTRRSNFASHERALLARLALRMMTTLHVSTIMSWLHGYNIKTSSSVVRLIKQLITPFHINIHIHVYKYIDQYDSPSLFRFGRTNKYQISES
jgi:hypothetical protein